MSPGLTLFYGLYLFLHFSTISYAQPPFDCVLNETHCSCETQNYDACPVPSAEERSLCYGVQCTGYSCLSSCENVHFVTKQCQASRVDLYVFTGMSGSEDQVEGCTVENRFVNNLIWEATPTKTELAEQVVDRGDGFILENGDSTSIFTSLFVGDINNDGFNDIAICVNRISQVSIIFGSKNTSLFEPFYDFRVLNGTNGFDIVSTGGNQFGAVMARGDINGDGISDVILGEPFGDPDGRGNAGIVYVVFGRTGLGLNQPQLLVRDLNGQNGFRINGYIAQARVGSFISVADVNNDGFDDIIMGSVPNPIFPDENEVFVVFGKPTFNPVLALNQLDGSNGFAVRLDTVDPSARSKTTPVASIDINGDNFADIIIGMSPTNENFVIYGRASFNAVVLASSLDGSTGFLLRGPPDFTTGLRVAALGDVNNDGLGDFSTTDLLQGTMFVIFGTREPQPSQVDLAVTELNGQNGFTAYGSSFGNTATYGDVNGDGIDDLVIGAAYAETDRGITGQVYVMYGRADGLFRSHYWAAYLTEEQGIVINGEDDNPDQGEEFGRSVSVMDFNNDGNDDILVSARASLPFHRAYVFYGEPLQ